jgi:hypothetical protein
MDVLKELLEEGLTLDSWTADGTELENIGQLAAILLDLQREVDHAEEKLKSVKEKLRVVQEGQLPAALEQAGLSEIKLSTGEKVKVATFYNCSIDAAKKDAAFDWLHDQGHGDIIKHTVSLDFKKGEAQLARTAISALMDEGFAPQDQTKVAPQTLKAFARVEVEAGRQLPDFFKLYIGQKATIK